MARSRLREFVDGLRGKQHHAAVKPALGAWFTRLKSRCGRTRQPSKPHTETRASSNDRIVFNIKGNAFRLIVSINYLRQVVFIKGLGSHADYDRIDASTVKYAGKAPQK